MGIDRQYGFLPCPVCGDDCHGMRRAAEQLHDNETTARMRAERLVHLKNVELDAMHFVWCTGGCDTGMHRWVPGILTEEMVEAAERNTRRMRDRFNSLRHRGKV